ncbi:NYN domain-containing protein [Laspinema sp. A4]|uniref:NYN domain-containing protein n=1 Tax=Laspinema sp. D2d TaxID=2953686 RepID=UPI0021BAA74D|nr:NYN domain-containing protein [Laspinema sp. D2d]MCT7981822.1 NYN domain-containing protein [Laspinema sp. D2d]
MSSQVSLGKVAIFCDTQNVPFQSEQQVGALLQFATEFGNPSYVKAYAGFRELKKSAIILDKFGIECRWVQESRFHKNDADKKINADCEQYILPDPDTSTVVLVSGDGDFIPLVRKLKVRGIQVMLISRSEKNTSVRLQKIVDKVYFLDYIEREFGSS